MGRTIVALTVLFASTALLAAQDAAGDEARYEAVLVKLLDSLNQMTKTLEGIVDEDTAKASREALRGHAAAFVATRKQSEELAPPSPEARERLARNYRPLFEKSRKELIAQIARVERVPGGNPSLQELRGVFDKKVP